MMAKRPQLFFSPEDLKVLAQQRYEHPDPRVQQRLEVLWLISQKVTQHQAAKLVGVSRATAKRNVAIYREGGMVALRQFHWCKPVSEMMQLRETLEESFGKNPPHTLAEACARIKEETGLERRPTQVGIFLKKCWI